VEAFPGVRPRLLEALPDFLRRNVSGDTDSEHAFMLFLKYLRQEGQLDGLDVPAGAVGRALALAARDLETWSREAGAQRPPTLNFIATNGRVLAATRRGRPLHYGLLEGIFPCDRDGISAATPESDPRVRPHRSVKAVCFASWLLAPNGFLEVPESSVVAVSRSLEVSVRSLVGYA